MIYIKKFSWLLGLAKYNIFFKRRNVWTAESMKYSNFSRAETAS